MSSAVYEVGFEMNGSSWNGEDKKNVLGISNVVDITLHIGVYIRTSWKSDTFTTHSLVFSHL